MPFAFTSASRVITNPENQSATQPSIEMIGSAETRTSPQKMRSPRGSLKASANIVLCVLLAVPGYALNRLSSQVDWRVLVGIPLAFSIVAFFVYRSDKRSAEAGEWRTPESTLHFLALMGGWPGAFLAQRIFRHKTSKQSFQLRNGARL